MEIIIILAIFFLFYIYYKSSTIKIIIAQPTPTVTIAPTGSIAVSKDSSAVPVPASQVIVGASPNITVVSTHESLIK